MLFHHGMCYLVIWAQTQMCGDLEGGGSGPKKLSSTMSNHRCFLLLLMIMLLLLLSIFKLLLLFILCSLFSSFIFEIYWCQYNYYIVAVISIVVCCCCCCCLLSIFFCDSFHYKKWNTTGCSQSFFGRGIKKETENISPKWVVKTKKIWNYFFAHPNSVHSRWRTRNPKVFLNK